VTRNTWIGSESPLETNLALGERDRVMAVATAFAVSESLGGGLDGRVATPVGFEPFP